MAETKTIDLTPNYPAMFRAFVDEIPRATKLAIEDAHDEGAEVYDRLEGLNTLLYNVSLALQCATTIAEINELRKVMDVALKQVNEAHRAALE